jgi:septum site-determining protein MinC
MQQVSIKGVRNGLQITFGTGEYDAILQDLTEELEKKQGFLSGGRIVLAVGNRSLTQQQLADLQTMFAREEMELWTVLSDAIDTREAARQQGLAIRMPGSHTDLDGNPVDIEPLQNGTNDPPPNTFDPNKHALIFKETLRGGRSIQHDGNVLVIGDINPGSEVIAGGDVIVWGKVRGLVHAGAYGDNSAVICALDLNPTQLRIADQIAVSPEHTPQNPVPEIAKIRHNQIQVETWDAK